MILMVLPILWGGQNVPFVALSGTATASIDETDVVAGGKTVVLTLMSDTWVAAGSTFNAQRQAILDKLVSDGSETNGWDAELSNLPVTDVVRTDDEIVTITLSALANYDITAQEVVSGGAPAAALVTSGSDLVANGTFTVAAIGTSSAITWPEGSNIEWPEGGNIEWP